MIKKLFILALYFTLTLQPAISAQKEDPTTQESASRTKEIVEILSNPVEFDGKKIWVEGVVEAVKYTKSSNGKPYTLFKLNDEEDNELGVYYKGEHLPIAKGDLVKVMGEFKKEKRYFIYTFKNVIRAKEVSETG